MAIGLKPLNADRQINKIMEKYIVYWRYRGCANTATHIEFIQSEKESKIDLEISIITFLKKEYNYNDIAIEAIKGIDFIHFETV